MYTLDNIDLVNSATSDFSLNNTDPKAQVITAYSSIGNQVRYYQATDYLSTYNEYI